MSKTIEELEAEIRSIHPGAIHRRTDLAYDPTSGEYRTPITTVWLGQIGDEYRGIGHTPDTALLDLIANLRASVTDKRLAGQQNQPIKTQSNSGQIPVK
jgi:hypothetical protein